MINIALIPARGGSKSIKKKNIVILGGRPLIYYTIEVAKKTKLIDRVIVSTDDEEIRDICFSLGAEAPFLRPKELSDDSSGDFEVVEHFLKWTRENESLIPDNIIYLRPDFPFRKVETLNDAINAYTIDEKADGLRSVNISREIPYKTWKIVNGCLFPATKYKKVTNPHNSARQLFPKTYYPTGYIEIYDSQLVLRDKTLIGKRMIPHIIKDEVQVNIGSVIDLEKAKKFINT